MFLVRAGTANCRCISCPLSRFTCPPSLARRSSFFSRFPTYRLFLSGYSHRRWAACARCVLWHFSGVMLPVRIPRFYVSVPLLCNSIYWWVCLLLLRLHRGSSLSCLANMFDGSLGGACSNTLAGRIFGFSFSRSYFYIAIPDLLSPPVFPSARIFRWYAIKSRLLSRSLLCMFYVIGCCGICTITPSSITC